MNRANQIIQEFDNVVSEDVLFTMLIEKLAKELARRYEYQGTISYETVHQAAAGAGIYKDYLPDLYQAIEDEGLDLVEGALAKGAPKLPF